MLGFGLGSTNLQSVRRDVARCARKSRAAEPAARRWECRRIGALDYEVNLEKVPQEVIPKVEIIQEAAGFDDETTKAFLELIPLMKDYPELRVVAVDGLCQRDLTTVEIARQALEDVAGESDIPAILKVSSLRSKIEYGIDLQFMEKLLSRCCVYDHYERPHQPFKGLNYSAQAECLKVLKSLGSPKVHKLTMEIAHDHMLSRIRRCACACLSGINYVERDEANDAFSLLLDLSSDPDWSVRYAALVSLERFKSRELVDDSFRRLKKVAEARVNEEDEDQLPIRLKAKALLTAMKQKVG